MLRTLTIALLALIIGGCTNMAPNNHQGDHRHVAGGNEYYEVVGHGAHQHRIVGKADTVTITNVSAEDNGIALANEYCSSRGKVAHALRPILYTSFHRTWHSTLFECVPAASG